MSGADGRRRLTLVRHGHAANAGAGQRDFDRALDRRGIAEVSEMARRCAELGQVPDLLLASTSRRTMETAAAFQRMLEHSPRPLRPEHALYLAEADTLLECIRQVDPDVRHLMLIAHNPGLGDLAEQLAPAARIAGFETGATLSMSFPSIGWPVVRPGLAEDLRYDTPGRFFDL